MKEKRLIDSLDQASNLELFRLSILIDRLLADPTRIVDVRQSLTLGQYVKFLDSRRGELSEGTVLGMSDRQVTIKELASRRVWKLPYVAIEPESVAAVRTPAMVPPPTYGPTDFCRGDRVAFEDRYARPHFGLIVRINSRTATVEGNGDTWRVPFELLRLVIDAK